MDTSNCLQKKPNGKWEPAEEEPYYSNWIEKLLCFFGFHTWVMNCSDHKWSCYRCGKEKPCGCKIHPCQHYK